MKLLDAMTLAAAIGAVPACSVDDDCTLEPNDPNAEVLQYTVLDESTCVNSITDACNGKPTGTNAVCAVSPNDLTSDVQKEVHACTDSSGIADMCDNNDVVLCNVSPQDSTLICNGEVR